MFTKCKMNIEFAFKKVTECLINNESQTRNQVAN